MTKLSFKKIKPSRKTIYITAGTIIVLAVIILALALNERQSRREAAQSAANVSATNTRLDGLEAQISTLRTSNDASQAKLAATCRYITTLSTTKTIKPAVVVPASCK